MSESEQRIAQDCYNKKCSAWKKKYKYNCSINNFTFGFSFCKEMKGRNNENQENED